MNSLGLFVAATIPVVMFMLWAEYFRQGWREELARAGSPDEEQLELAIARVRIAGLLATTLELVIFLATSPIRQEDALAGMLGLWITLGALVFQRIQQAGLENELLSAQATPEGGSARARPAPVLGSGLLWAFAGVVMYLSLLGGSMFAAALAIAVFKWTGLKAMLALGAGTVVGYSLALASNFVFSPWLLKKVIPSVEFPDCSAKTAIEGWFREAKVAMPDLRITDSTAIQAANAWVTGFAWLGGALKPVLWTTPTLLHELSAAELEAVLKHEIVHLRRNHLTLRFAMAWAMSLLVLLSLSGALALSALLPASATGPIAPAFSLFLSVAMVWGAMKGLEEQSRMHELEADWLSVIELGASAIALASALRKTHISKQGGSHPLLAVRLEALAPLIAQEKEAQEKESHEQDSRRAA